MSVMFFTKTSGVKLGVIGIFVLLLIYFIPIVIHHSSAIDGGYSEWTAWSTCFKTCGESIQGRTRNCINPKPNKFGRDCLHLGSYIESKSCKLKECPQDGEVGPWTDWTECDKPCKDGKRKRSRKCDSPAPAAGGSDCKDTLQEEQQCLHLRGCPVNGLFSVWTGWEACSVTCGKGHHLRRRSCNNPAPAWGGQNCVGALEEFEDCNDKPCSTPTVAPSPTTSKSNVS